MILTRTSIGTDGVFGDLVSDDGKWACKTLEHAYVFGSVPTPKIPQGTYPCIRGEHRLVNMGKSFETFAVCAVPGHSGILFHVGNTSGDSSGCVLLGKEIVESGSGRMITDSKETFESFMNYLMMDNTFQLVVKNQY